MKNSVVISGIDTEVGKTIVTGLLGRWFCKLGKNAVTMKVAETGVAESVMSADIRTHRQLMGIEPLDADLDGTTCPYRFRLPASPHLAAATEDREIEPQRIVKAALRLRKHFETVLIEGVGGLLVPLTRDYLFIDFVREIGAPVVLVTSGKLGSINHTLLSLEALAARNIPLAGLVYNHYGNHYGAENDEIRRDSLDYFRYRLGKADAVVEMPAFDRNNPPDIDFSPLFEGRSVIGR